VLDKFYYHLKLLHLFLIHPVYLNTSDNVTVNKIYLLLLKKYCNIVLLIPRFALISF
jgi:hypothetical protein